MTYYDGTPVKGHTPLTVVGLLLTAFGGIFIGSVAADYTSPPLNPEPLVGINCASTQPVMLAEEEDLFPAPCDEVTTLSDYCSTDSGVEDEICIDTN